jgi:hypothetical protein
MYFSSEIPNDSLKEPFRCTHKAFENYISSNLNFQKNSVSGVLLEVETNKP